MPLDNIETKWTLKASKEEAGAFSDRNSKMPGSTFATDAFACKVGSKLAEVEGSVCNRCYARKLQKLRPSVDKGWSNNYEKATTLIANNPDRWASACVFQIERMANKSGEFFHRWFDSGDLDSVAMLAAICDVAARTPQIQHWLPTREAAMVKAYRKQGGHVPSNLTIRVSSTMIGDAPIRGHENTSTVHRKGDAPEGHICPAPKQGGNCGDCRACWDKSVKTVSYCLH